MLDLKPILRGKVVIVCIGNKDRGDDGAGPAVSEAIKGKVPYEVIDAGMTPENYTGVIRKLNPDTIIIVDSVYFEGKAGEIRLFAAEDLHSGKITTHDVSPKLLIEYLKSSMDADIYVLGIKPKSNNFGETLSRECKEAVKELAKLFMMS